MNAKTVIGKNILKEIQESVSKIQIPDTFEQVVEEMLNCKGTIVTTGMGKAGIAMRKFSSTLCSFGFSSTYLHPGEASHGDLGVLGEEDILFVASTSGKTREVVEVVDLARNISVKKVIGITSHLDSLIRDKSDLILDMGHVEEAGILKLAPTSSILVMSALTDTVALTMAECKGVDFAEYFKYHHSGYLGDIAKEKASQKK